MASPKVDELFASFSQLKVIIIGDVMIDAYLWGRVDRISPEAPVPIVSVTKREERLGGAANVALNIVSLGAIPILCSVIGDDEKGKLFLELMDKHTMPKHGFVKSAYRPTTIKTRVIGGNQQMLRVDQEVDSNLTDDETNKLSERIQTILNSEKIDVVIFEDYDKGVITNKLISGIISLCKIISVPVCVDPKKRNFLSYTNATFFKPNLKELTEGLKLEIVGSDIEGVRKAAHKLMLSLNFKIVMVTLSKHGVLIIDEKEFFHIPAHQRDIADVSGAGDTVISVASLCLALGLDIKAIATLSNLAGGLVCEKIGVVPIDKEMFKSEIGLQ